MLLNGDPDFSAYRVALHNLGCKVNAYEGEKMLSLLRAAGAEAVPWEETADIYIINTCSVTNIADRKSRQMLHRARAKNPDALVVAAGCYVDARAEELRQDSGVDVLIGNGQKGEIARILGAYLEGREAEKALPFGAVQRERAGSLTFTENRTRAFLKVQDGCNQFCTYCIIPYVRGRIKSRRIEDCVSEARQLTAQGHRELVLCGIHLSSYGREWEEGGGALSGAYLLRLLSALSDVEGVERIRLGSLEPRILTADFAGALRHLPKLCPHFHLSLQSGCDRILKAMNRHYDTAAFKKGVGVLREAFPDAALTGDVIVGFPGETEEDFAESCRFLWEIGFYELHVFKYSRRRGTAADRMPDQIPERVKGERSARVLAITKAQSENFRRRFLYKEAELLPEELVHFEGQAFLSGFSREYVRYLLPVGDEARAFGQIGKSLHVFGKKICATYILAETAKIV